MKELRFKNDVLNDGAEPVAIIIEGERTQLDGSTHVVEERFECMATPPAAAVNIIITGGSLIEYVRLCLDPKEEERFAQLLTDKDFNVQLPTVRRVYEALVEHYAQRPTGASMPSGDGRDTSTAGSSPADSPSPESTSPSSS